jgi:hypothetical protein
MVDTLLCVSGTSLEERIGDVQPHTGTYQQSTGLDKYWQCESRKRQIHPPSGSRYYYHLLVPTMQDGTEYASSKAACTIGGAAPSFSFFACMCVCVRVCMPLLNSLVSPPSRVTHTHTHTRASCIAVSPEALLDSRPLGHYLLMNSCINKLST